MKINFKAITCVIDFEGTETAFDIAKKVGNLMAFDGARILDRGIKNVLNIK